MIETERLILRPIQKEDAKDIFEYATDKDTGPMAGWSPHQTIDDTNAIIDVWMDPDYKERVYAVIYKPDNKTIGTIGITNLNKTKKDEKNTFVNKLLNEDKKAYEIGNVIGKKYWGLGISTECLNAMMDYLFENTDADIVVTCHYALNIGSKKVQEKNHMRILGDYERDEKWHNTECTTMVVRGKTRDEWQNEKETENAKE